MTTIERHGVWGWRLAGVAMAIAIYLLVVRPMVRAAFQHVVDELATEVEAR